MTDIKISLRIKDDIEFKDGELGIAIAAELPATVGAPIEAHLEAYGFNASQQGALAVASMLEDMAAALRRELGPPDQTGHNPISPQCIFAVAGQTKGPARCPVCAPKRPAFSPQPRKA